jgi:hypothetical protein
MDKYIIVFCEGDHDVAFLSRILLVNGFTPYDKKVKNFIVPLNDLYISALKDKKIEDSKFKFQRANTKVPYAVFEKDNKLVIFHNLGGDGNILNDKAKDIMELYLEQNDELLREVNGYDTLDYRFLYFLDADEEGVETRLSEVSDLLSLPNQLEHYEVIKQNDYEISCCIFYNSKYDNTHGKLEDILLELMSPSNEIIFKESQTFISTHLLSNVRQRKFICTHEKEESRGSIQFKKEKSIISIAGQLQFSGSSNSVIIANSDYIKKSDIDGNIICQNIIKMFL